MASCDDDFGLLGDDAQPPHTPQPPHQQQPQPQQTFYVQTKPSCFPDDDGADPFAPAAAQEEAPERKSSQHPKRRDRAPATEDFSDGGEYCSYLNSGGGQSSKKGRGTAPASGADYRKDREEWTEGAIGSLLDAYTARFEQLNRGNLRGRDWEDVAAAVSEQHRKAGGGKSVEQCKNKIDNLKKRYKVECQRLAGGGGAAAASHWPWFKKMENIVGNSPSPSSSSKPLAPDEDKSRHQQQHNNKRYPPTGVPLSVVAGSRMTALSNPRWKRVLIKIGGSVLAGAAPQNVDPKVIMLIAREVQVASHHGVEVAIVVGGRNVFCSDTWAAATGTDRASTYPIG